jgi:D-alanyl-D-alanine carboxypeptidase (penicillin-binding protein 5/6)
MNERAKQLGCTNTNFHNPNGLNDELHTTSAHDLALMAREAMKYPEFREMVKTHKHTIERSINTADSILISKNRLVSTDPTADGIKTGFTRPAGQCFVGSATRGGYRMISVVLGSEAWLPDTQSLLNWGFNNHEVKRALTAGQPLPEKLKVAGKEIQVAPVRALRYVAKKGSNSALKIEPTFLPHVNTPLAKGQQVGIVRISDEEGWSDTIPLVALETVDGPQASAGLPKGPFFVIGACFVGLWAWTKRKRKQFYGRRIAF